MSQNITQENNASKVKGGESAWCSFKNEETKQIALREEKALINLLLQSKELVSEIIACGVKYYYFWWNDCSEFYKIITRYFDQYKSILTREQFRNEVERFFKSTEDQTYYRNLYDEMINLGTSAEDFPALKSGIRNRNLLQQASKIIQNNYSSILEAKGSSGKEVDKFVQDVLKIEGAGGDEYAQTITFGDSLKEVWKQLEDRQTHPEKYYGLMSGFKTLDKRFHGFLKGKYLVFTGMPNGGKTTVMFNLGMNMATLYKHNVVYVTIESEHMRATQRVLCIYAGVDENRILRGGSGSEGLDAETMKTLTKAKEELSGMENFSWIQVVQGTTATKILEMVERRKAYGNIDVLIIDYLDVVGRDKVYPSRPDLELAHVSATFQAYGKRTGTLIITAQQLKAAMVQKLQKAKDSYTAFDAGVGDVSGSQQIVAAADYVLAVVIDQKSKDRIYLRSTKARFNRSLDVYTLSFDTNSGRLSDMPSLEGYEAIGQKLENDDTKKLAIKAVEEDKKLLDVKEIEAKTAGVEDILPTDDVGSDFTFGDS